MQLAKKPGSGNVLITVFLVIFAGPLTVPASQPETG